MVLYIKNMVSNPGKVVVKAELEKSGFHCTAIELGEAHIDEELTDEQLKAFNARLQPYGLELMTDHKARIIERIKNLVIHLVHFSEEEFHINISTYISSALRLNYNYLSNLFSEMQGLTIEKFVILHKIERVKELLTYDEFTLSEIADRLQYSSLAHMSSQFKKVTGMTPTDFKKSKHKVLIPIEELTGHMANMAL